VSQPPAMVPAVRQALVSQLLAGDPTLSNRDIAAQLGVSKDTVRRDRAEMRQAQEKAAPETAAPEPEDEAAETPRAPDDALGAPPEEPKPAPDAPPGDVRLTVAHDDEQLLAGLDILAEAGHTRDEAVRLAVTMLARAYEGAWKFGLYPRGTAPRVRVVDLYPYKQEGQRP